MARWKFPYVSDARNHRSIDLRFLQENVDPLSVAHDMSGKPDALAFALSFSGRERVHNADELMSAIVARRLVERLERSGFVVLKKPPIGGGAALGRGFESS